MKKSWLIVLLVLLVDLAFAQERPTVDYVVLQPGEQLTYKVTYGYFTVGEAKIETSNTVHLLSGVPTHKVEITGRTTGAVGLVAKIDDRWGAYLNKENQLPVKGYRIIRENNYKRDEVSFFDYQQKHVRYLRYDHKAGKYNEPVIMQFENTVRDLISGYHYLRQIDYAKLHKGDTIHLAGFFEDEFYNFKVLYKGKEKLKTHFGKITSIKLVPVMPDNKIFNGENSISIWLSDDNNRIPLKIEADMFVGKAGCEIVGYNNLKSKLIIASK